MTYKGKSGNTYCVCIKIIHHRPVPYFQYNSTKQNKKLRKCRNKRKFNNISYIVIDTTKSFIFSAA